jgi:hypothetical protein
VTAEKQRLLDTLAQQESILRRAFLSFLAEARSNRMTKEVTALIQRGHLEPALALVDQHITVLGNTVPKIFTNVANSELDAAAGRMRPSVIQKASVVGTVAVGFDPTHDRAARLMRTARLNFIEQFTREQRNATRVALVNSFQRGQGAETAARAFKDSIGLTRIQQSAVENYRRLLTLRSPEALARDLRDRRFDQRITNAIESGEALSSTQIDRMVERYHERMLTSRAVTIARTESHRIQSEAQQEALSQLVEQTGIEEGAVVQVWNATQDHRTRDSHFAMDGQRRRFGEAFTTPQGVRLRYPGDPRAPAGEVINCRCVLSTVILTQDEMMEEAA